MKYLHNDSTDPYFNMAFDQHCLESTDFGEPVFYLWRNRPSVIIGISQNIWSEVNLDYLKEYGILPVRRVTGGGAVYHDLNNLNYSIIGKSKDLKEDYPEYTSIISGALCRLGVDARLSGRNDIMVNGKKVSGFAKRVWKDRVIIHGTLMYDVDMERLTAALSAPGSKMDAKGVESVRSRVTNLKDMLPDMTSVLDLKDRLEDILSNSYKDPMLRLTDKDMDEIRRIASEKFSTWEWIYGKSPEASLTCRKKFSCGTVEAGILIDRSIIKHIKFAGD